MRIKGNLRESQGSIRRKPRTIVLRPSDHGKVMSLEDFERAERTEGYVFELVFGRIGVTATPEMPHDDDLEWIRGVLEAFRRKRPDVIGRVSSRARVYSTSDLAAVCLKPDLAVYRENPRLLPAAKRKWRNLKAILVVEIISPDSADKDLKRNVMLYLLAESIREYWIVDSREHLDQPKLIIYRRRGKRWQKPIEVPFGGTYETKLLPGFTLLVDPLQAM
jgi:Uma2 family endonuclease